MSRGRLSPGAWLVLAALVLYLPAVWWGAPVATAPDRVKAWAVDDESPLGPIAEIGNMLHPRPDRNFGYPLLYSYLADAAYSPYLGYLYLTGKLRAPSPNYPFGLADPVSTLRVLTVLAHLVTVVLALGAVFGAYSAARMIWGPRSGVLAAISVMTLYPMFYYARTGNVDVPMLCFVMLGYAALARMVKYGVTRRRAILLGVALGLAMATKESALGAVVGFVPAALFAPRADGLGPRDWHRPLWWAPWACGLLAAFIALGLGSGFFIEPGRYLAHLAFTTGRLEAAPVAGKTIPIAFPYTLDGNLRYLRDMSGYLVQSLTWPGIALAAAGLWAIVRGGGRQAWMVLPAVSYLAFIFLTLRSGQLRYVLPAAALLAIFAGHAAALGLARSRVDLRLASLLLLTAAVGLNLLRGIDLTYAMLRDARWSAAAWLAERLEPGDHVEYFGASQKLPPLPAGVQTDRSTEYHGLFFQHDTSAAKVAEIIAGWQERRPRFLIIMPDHTSRPGAPFDASFPPALYRRLVAGSLSYVPAATFQTPPLLPWVHRPRLDYPSVNPPIRIFAPRDQVRHPRTASSAKPPCVVSTQQNVDC